MGAGDTVDFLKEVTEFLPDPPYGRLSINRLEALPGTPVYEYGKALGLIGRTPEDEEKYLLHISDTSGGDSGKQLNFTDYPDFVVQAWRRLMWFGCWATRSWPRTSRSPTPSSPPPPATLSRRKPLHWHLELLVDRQFLFKFDNLTNLNRIADLIQYPRHHVAEV